MAIKLPTASFKAQLGQLQCDETDFCSAKHLPTKSMIDHLAALPGVLGGLQANCAGTQPIDFSDLKDCVLVTICCSLSAPPVSSGRAMGEVHQCRLEGLPQHGAAKASKLPAPGAQVQINPEVGRGVRLGGNTSTTTEITPGTSSAWSHQVISPQDSHLIV